MPEAPYGTWRSSVTARDVARGGVRLGSVSVVGGRIWWSEGRPSEGGRTAIVYRDADGDVHDALPSGWNARTRVHEYGGGAWVALSDGSLVFANWADQRLYLQRLGDGEPLPLTAAPAEPQSDRYADLVLSPRGDEVICVRERSLGKGPAVEHDIVAVPLDGSTKLRRVVSDGHFVSNPRPSPDGTRLSWLTWEHPRMPWDGTEMRVGELEGGSITRPRTLLGGPEESVFQPEWVGDEALYAVSDRTGWWNLYEVALSGEMRPLCPRDEEFGHPQWIFGMSRHALLGDGRLAVTHGVGTWELSLLDTATGELSSAIGPEHGLTYYEPSISAEGSTVAVLGGGPSSPMSVLEVDLSSGSVKTVRRSIDRVPDPKFVPEVRAVTFEGRGGRDVHAFVRPPSNPEFRGPPGETPPFVAFVHGGPTAQAVPVLDMQATYFTSRGIGVVDVDYGGSTGYGRRYRKTLDGQWGVVDVEDVVAAMVGLAQQGDADPRRLLIRGSSAGGWTVLVALTQTDVFAAGASYYGVADLMGLVEDTHDFESRYVDGLVGPLPAARSVYDERSPLSHVEELHRPILLLQGSEDRIVPPEQAEKFREAMVRNGIPHALLLFEGEQHGFRRAETIETALEAELSFYGQVLGFEPPDVPVLAMTGPTS